MSRALHKLEDRVLVLKDRVDSLVTKFDPNQVRDDHGRWSVQGVATAVGSVALAVGAAAFGARRVHKSFVREAVNTAKRYGVAAEKVSVHYRGGKSGQLGQANLQNGRIGVWPLQVALDQVSKNSITSTIAHEATHIRFQKWGTNAVNDEWVTKNLNKLRAEGGVTPYSKQFWEQVDKGGTLAGLYAPQRKLLAIHETLAEMSAVKEVTGKLPGGPTFQELHKRVFS